MDCAGRLPGSAPSPHIEPEHGNRGDGLLYGWMSTKGQPAFQRSNDLLSGGGVSRVVTEGGGCLFWYECIGLKEGRHSRPFVSTPIKPERERGGGKRKMRPRKLGLTFAGVTARQIDTQ